MSTVRVFLSMTNPVLITTATTKTPEVAFLSLRLVLLGITCSEKKMNEKTILVNESSKISCLFSVRTSGVFLLYRCERRQKNSDWVLYKRRYPGVEL